MLAILGVIIVFAAVLGGFVLEKGNPWVLLQPAELLIVGGAAAGIVLAANPKLVIRKMARGLVNVFRKPEHDRGSYLRALRMLYELFSYGRRGGIPALEPEVETPAAGKIFPHYPEFLREKETLDFICDSIRIMVVGVNSPHELDQMMDLDIDVQRRGRHEPVAALSAMADALPGLGIVAAVLGVVVTMQSIGGAPDEIGKNVAAALVGTFIGILLCYGVAGPLAAQLEHRMEAHVQFLQVLRTAIVAYAKGASPVLAVEVARRSVPVELRPSFIDLERTLRKEARIPTVGDKGGVHVSPGVVASVGAAAPAA